VVLDVWVRGEVGEEEREEEEGKGKETG